MQVRSRPGGIRHSGNINATGRPRPPAAATGVRPRLLGSAAGFPCRAVSMVSAHGLSPWSQPTVRLRFGPCPVHVRPCGIIPCKRSDRRPQAAVSVPGNGGGIPAPAPARRIFTVLCTHRPPMGKTGGAGSWHGTPVGNPMPFGACDISGKKESGVDDTRRIEHPVPASGTARPGGEGEPDPGEGPLARPGQRLKG